MASGKKGVETAKNFLWDNDDEDDGMNLRTRSGGGATGPGGAASSRGGGGGFSTRDYAVDQSVNLMAMGDVDLEKSARRQHGQSASGGSSSGGIFGLFRGGSTPGGKTGGTNLSKFDEYGDAAPSTESEEYIGNDKARRLNPFVAAIANACIGCFDSFALACGRFSPQTQRVLCFGTLGIVAIVIIVMLTGGEDSNKQIVNSYTELLQNAGIDTSLLTVSGSPQQKAYQWITTEDEASLEVEASGFVERFVLAVVWYNNGGNDAHTGWTKTDGWMSGTGYCSWHGIECVPNDNDEKQYDANAPLISIQLPNNNIEGALPPDLKALSNLQSLGLQHNKMSGKIVIPNLPTEELRNLALQHNSFVGSLSSDIGSMSNLHELYVGHNQLTGTIPSTLNKLTELRAFGVTSNLIGGSLPSTLKDLTKLLTFWVDDNNMSGTIPPSLFAKEFDLGTHTNSRIL